jgi:hypothetical protein
MNTSIFIELGNGDNFVFDIGEANYISAGLALNQLDKIFITHRTARPASGSGTPCWLRDKCATRCRNWGEPPRRLRCPQPREQPPRRGRASRAYRWATSTAPRPQRRRPAWPPPPVMT